MTVFDGRLSFFLPEILFVMTASFLCFEVSGSSSLEQSSVASDSQSKGTLSLFCIWVGDVSVVEQCTYSTLIAKEHIH